MKVEKKIPANVQYAVVLTLTQQEAATLRDLAYQSQHPWSGALFSALVDQIGAGELPFKTLNT